MTHITMTRSLDVSEAEAERRLSMVYNLLLSLSADADDQNDAAGGDGVSRPVPPAGETPQPVEAEALEG